MNHQIETATLEYEQALVGCALLAPEDTRQSCGWLHPELFWSESIRQFWTRFRIGENPHELILELGFYKAGQRPYTWMNDIPSYTYAGDYARHIARQAYLKDISTDTAQATQAIAKGDYETATRLVRQMADKTPQAHREVRNAIDVGESFLLLLQSEQRNIDTFVAGLDPAIGGLERQSMSVLAAPPSTGKSTLAFQIARNVATHGGRVLFVSLEMPEANLWARAACGSVGLAYLDVRRYRKPEDIAKVEAACSDLMFKYGHNLMIYDRPASTTDVWELVSAKRPDLVIIDHIRFLSDQHAEGREVKRLGLICQRLRDIAKLFDCHVMALAQLNRSPILRATDDRRPKLSDLRDSGEIEENADLVLMMYVESDGTDEVSKKTDIHNVPTELWVRKARDGKRDAVVKLLFDRHTQWLYGKDEPR